MSVNLYVIIELPDGEILDGDFCYEYPDSVSQTDFMKACIENHNALHDSNPCPELKVSGYEILVNGSLFMPRMLDGELFQSPDVDPELLVKIITLRPRTKRPLSSTSPPPAPEKEETQPAPKKGETPPVRIALPVEVARPTSPRPDLLTPNEIIILQHILTQAGGNAQKFPKPITQTAPGIYAEKDIRKRAADLEKMLGELSLVEPILSACARDLVGDLEEVRKYAKGITMPPIKDGFKDDPTGRYYQGLLDVPFPMDNLGRLIANHNRLMCSSVYTSFEPGPRPFVAPPRKFVGKVVEPLNPLKAEAAKKRFAAAYAKKKK